MARKTKKNKNENIEAYRHEAETRKNAVSVGLASYDTSKPKHKKYEYNPPIIFFTELKMSKVVS